MRQTFNKMPDVIRCQQNAWGNIGRWRGRLHLVGLAKYYRKKWVARCECGKYALISLKSFNESGEFGLQCGECQDNKGVA